MSSFIAHTRSCDCQTQELKLHLEATAQIAAEFAREFGAENIAYRCGLLHDIGKYSKAFQKRIMENGPRTDHSTAGAIEAFKLNDIYSAFCIAGHHGGLPDGGNKKFDSPDDSTLMGRLKREQGKQIDGYSIYSDEIRVPEAAPPDYLSKSMFGNAFFIRMLYSALIDADYLDTEAFMSNGKAERGCYDNIETLLKRLEKYINPWWGNQIELNKKRSEILRVCLDSGRQNKGLYTLTVPTGGGKTISSLAFALRHAKTYNMKRVIYVIPYTNIIEQTAQVFGNAVGAENVLEHHSQAVYDLNENDHEPDSIKRQLSAENWDAPLIITTSVQFFESLFSNKSSQCRKLHNIANSVLIFDEAQMLPVSYLKPCVAALSELVENYGCTVVLCTATQPSLGKLFQDYNPALKIKEICPDAHMLSQFFRRVCFCDDGLLSDTEISTRLNAHNQVLCIVNRREEAQTIYEMLDSEGRYHLSTLMIPFDRKARLSEIKERLKDDLPCRVVSTSLVEAGVDLDFPTVFRAQAGLDCILQAAGRCNREGRRPVDKSIVHIFQAEKPVPRLFEQNVAVARLIMRTLGDFSSSEAVQNYFDLLHTIKGSALDQKDIMDAWESGIDGKLFPFATVAEMFRLIETNTRTIYIPIEQGRACIKRLQNGERSRSLFREAGLFAVDVYPQHYMALFKSGAIQVLDEVISILTDITLYNRNTGLSLTTSAGKALFV